MELQLENIIGRSVGVQGRCSCFTCADEAVLSTQDNDWTVDQFHRELFGLSCGSRLIDDCSAEQTCYVVKALICNSLLSIKIRNSAHLRCQQWQQAARFS